MSRVQVPPRVDVVHVVPHTNAFGIVPLNDTETGLAEAVVCSLCSPPNMRRLVLQKVPPEGS